MLAYEHQILYPASMRMFELPSMELHIEDASQKRAEIYLKYDMHTPDIIDNTVQVLPNGSSVINANRKINFPSLDAVRELLIVTGLYSWSDEVFQMLEDNLITQRIRIVDTSSDTVILDWTDVPAIRGQDFVNWANETII